jgi:hypothetical protein
MPSRRRIFWLTADCKRPMTSAAAVKLPASATAMKAQSSPNAEGTRVASRWKLRGKNKGFIGGRCCGTAFEMSGTAVWEVRADGLLQHNGVERNALEVHREIMGL